MLLAPADRTRDLYSTWSIVLIVLVVISQLVLNNGEGLLERLFKARHSATAESVSTDSFEKLQAIDNEVKLAYVSSLVPQGSLLTNEIYIQAGLTVPKVKNGIPLSPFHRLLEDALNSSLAALRATPDSIYFARRVILLRLVLSINAFDPVPTVGKHRGMASPLHAYDLYAAESPDIARQIDKEKLFWTSCFSPSPIQKQLLPKRLNELNQFPTLLFYSLIARQQIYYKASSFAEAKHLNQVIQLRAVGSMAGLLFLGGSVSLLLLAGVVVWIGTINTGSYVWLGAPVPWLRRRLDVIVDVRPATIRGPFARFLLPSPERIAPDDRKLRAGDLLDCFAIYLVSLTAFGTILSLLLHVVPNSTFHKLTIIQISYLNIGFDLVSYIGASGFALAVLAYKARKRGASLSEELNLSTKNAGKNIAFGIVGWGSAAVLLMVVDLVSHQVLHRLPAPENPALPLLSFAPNTIARFALYGMAAIAAPFFEETFFRGVLLNSLLLRFGPVASCVLTGLMFGGVHPVGIADALSLAALGAIFAWMAYLRKSLVPSMFAHFMQNSYAFFAVYFTFAFLARH